MNPFHEYLEKILSDHLKKRRVLVWYDQRREFSPFVDEILAGAEPRNGLFEVAVAEQDAFLARFQGSFFEIRHAVEPLVASDNPAYLIIYIPGAARDKDGSVLMELEKGGCCFEWKLKTQARFCLRDKFTDGVIDEMLKTESVGYEDIVGFLKQDGGEMPSVLRAVFENARKNQEIVAQFLSDSSRDDKLMEKGVVPELLRLVESRLGLSLAPDTPLGEAREKVLRYVLVNEFRSDLSCDPPASVTMVPQTQTKEQLDLACKVARTMRENLPETYAELSDGVASEFDLTVGGVDPERLGKVDTFRFEEAALLSLANDLVRLGRYEDALRIVTERKRSFWVDRSLSRQSQWEACRLMARLGSRIGEARKELKKTGDSPKAWVEAYCRDDGWRLVDQAQHAVEAWVAKMDEEPENESALETVRQAYEDILQDMTCGFMEALSKNNWSVGDVLSQTRVYGTVVGRENSPAAYFLVDAMRYAMAAELANLLPNAKDLSIKPAVGAWPTVTPIGMAALLPGAESDFCVVKDQGKLAARVEGTVLGNVSKRMKYLKAKVPGAVEMQLEKLLEMSSGKLERTVERAPLIVVRSQEIDALGEIAGNLVARQLMDTMVGNVARAVKKLSAAGIRRFVVTADHGHLFTRKKEDSFKTDNPGGKTVEIHRRCWVGHGGTTPPGTVRLSGVQIGYDTDLEFVFPKGAGVFKTGGDLGYHHGGLSLQETIVPVLSFKLGDEKAQACAQGEVRLLGEPERIANRTFGIELVLAGLFDVEPFAVRPLLLSKGAVVGKAGMAVDAEFDEEKGDVLLQPQRKAGVAMILEKDDVETCKIVVQDPATDRVMAQSKDIAIKLGTK